MHFHATNRYWLTIAPENTVKRADAQKAEEKFTQMLSEKNISDGARWSDVSARRGPLLAFRETMLTHHLWNTH